MQNYWYCLRRWIKKMQRFSMLFVRQPPLAVIDATNKKQETRGRRKFVVRRSAGLSESLVFPDRGRPHYNRRYGQRGGGDVGVAPYNQLPVICRSGPPKAVPTDNRRRRYNNSAFLILNSKGAIAQVGRSAACSLRLSAA